MEELKKSILIKQIGRKKNLPSRCSPFSLITSCILLISGAISQCIQGEATLISVSFLLMGVTSVIHHSRLEKWWITDIWRFLDYFAIVIFIISSSLAFKNSKLWYLTFFVSFFIQILIWSNIVNEKYIPYVHGLIHIMVSIVVIYLLVKNKK